MLFTLQEVFTKAINTTPIDKQEALRGNMADLRTSLESLTMEVKATSAQLKSALNRWDDFAENKNKMNSWLNTLENAFEEQPEVKSELNEMKNQLERYYSFLFISLFVLLYFFIFSSNQGYEKQLDHGRINI